MSPILESTGSVKGYGWGAVTALPPSFDSIASITTTASSSITFSSIPSTYKHLQIRWSGTTGAGSAAYLRINGNTSSAYAYSDFYFNDSSFSGFQGVGEIYLGQVRGSTGILDIFDVQATKVKVVKMWNGDFGSLLMMNAGVLAGETAPITSLTLWGLNVSGITYSLYGVK
jgi:hypothetical protein